jgi:hypothetical protein
MTKKTEKRDQHMEAAAAYMLEVVTVAETRGATAAEVAEAFAAIVAARNAELAGKCLVVL